MRESKTSRERRNWRIPRSRKMQRRTRLHRTKARETISHLRNCQILIRLAVEYTLILKIMLMGMLALQVQAHIPKRYSKLTKSGLMLINGKLMLIRLSGPTNSSFSKPRCMRPPSVPRTVTLWSGKNSLSSPCTKWNSSPERSSWTSGRNWPTTSSMNCSLNWVRSLVNLHTLKWSARISTRGHEAPRHCLLSPLELKVFTIIIVAAKVMRGCSLGLVSRNHGSKREMRKENVIHWKESDQLSKQQILTKTSQTLRLIRVIIAQVRNNRNANLTRSRRWRTPIRRILLTV